MGTDTSDFSLWQENLNENFARIDHATATPALPERPTRSRDIHVALFVTALAFLATMFFPSLSSTDLVEQDRWPFVGLLWVAAVAFWVRTFRPGQN